MKILTKKVYYCDFCRKKGLSSYHIREHEIHCTMNPERQCGVCGFKEPVRELMRKNLVIFKFKDHISIEELPELQKKIECPACLLACFRQSKVVIWNDFFDYKKEMKEYWKKKETHIPPYEG